MSYKYRLIEVLGQGGFGIVYRALQVDLGREVACKVARQELLENDPTSARFHREMEACAALSHPNIVKIFDFGRLGDGRLFYTMELLDATELGTIVKQAGPLPVDDAVSYLTQAADALAHLHERSMIHRDIKPSNLMVDGEGRLIVMDFSVVWIDGRTKLTQTGASCGTLLYMAPENLDGQSPARPSMDVYGLGVTFWEALAGRRMYESKPLLSLLEDLRNTRAAPIRSVRPDMPEWLSDLLDSALSRDPDARPTCIAIVEACRRHMASTPRTRASSTIPGSTAGRCSRASTTGSGSSRRLVLAGVAAVVVLSSISWLWLARSRESREPETRRGSASAIGGPAFRLGRVSFPGFRRMSIDLEGDPGPGAIFELGDGQRTVRRGTLEDSRRAVVFERLPADVACQAVALAAGRIVPAPLEVRLPRVVALREFLLVPSDRSVLVDFDLPEELPVTVELHRIGERNPECTSSVRSTSFHKVFTGLKPATDYLVRVSSRGVWMGLADHPFTTLDDKDRAIRVAWVSQLESLLSGFEEYFSDRPTLDPALVDPVMKAYLRRRQVTANSREFLIWLTAGLRSPELADVLLGLSGPARDSIWEAQTLVRARHPKGVQLVRGHFQSASTKDFQRAARLLFRCGGRADRDLIARSPDALKDLRLQPEVLIEWDRSRARQLFRGWLRTESPESKDSILPDAIRGLYLLGDEESLRALEECLSTAWPKATRIAVAWQLAPVGGPRIRELLSNLVRQGPDPFDYLWAFAHCATPDDAPVFESLLAQSKDWRVRGAAALVLGHLEAKAAAPTVRSALKDSDPRVVLAASWASGRLGDRAAGALLEQLVASGRDVAGVAAHALGEIDRRAAVKILRSSLQLRLKRQTTHDLAALGPTVHALDKLTDGEMRNEIETAISVARIPAPVQRLVRTLLVEARQGHPTALRVVLAQELIMGVFRAGIHCYPGDWVEIECQGFWSASSAGQLPEDASAKAERPEGRRLDVSFCGTVKDQQWLPAYTPRFVVQREGELKVGLLIGLRGAGFTEPTEPWADLYGMGLVKIRSSAEGADRADRLSPPGSGGSPGRAADTGASSRPVAAGSPVVPAARVPEAPSPSTP